MSGGVAAPVREELPDTVEDTEQDPMWDVLVWDDPVNLMAYVVHVFKKVLGVSEKRATKLMLEVHTDGRSLVATEPREIAERYLRQLHEHGLQATVRSSS
jgi:ATP-dependent Clp protease adaptor protein ClpS